MKGHYINCPDPTDCWCEVRRLSKVLWITLGILIFEIIGGIVSGSLALLADAGHVFGDSTAVVVTLFAAVLVRFGAQTQRVRDFAFWINIGLLFLIVIWIVFEAIKRFGNPNEIMSSVMIVVAFIGGVGNYWHLDKWLDSDRPTALYWNCLLDCISYISTYIQLIW